MKVPVYLIEHGETKFDQQGRVHKGIDEPLLPKGRKESQRLGERIRRMADAPTHLYASDAKRTLETARIAGKTAGVPVTPTPDLRAQRIGKMEGQEQTKAAKELKPYFDHPNRKVPGGESVNAWRNRHLGFMRRVVKAASKSGEVPGFVTHSNVNGSARAYAQGSEDGRLSLGNPPPPASIRKVNFPVAGARGRKP